MKYIDISKLSDSQINKEPFDHIILDGLVYTEKIEEVLEDVETLDLKDSDSKFDNKEFEYNKLGFGKNKLSKRLKELFDELNSSKFLQILEKLFKIKYLQKDPDILGGGVHIIKNDGFLGIHRDFNKINVNNISYLRKLNIIIYLNKKWKDSYNGHLKLYDKKLNVQKKIIPLLNRCIIFNTDQYSLHGHPEPLNCGNDIKRMSIANYYYIQNDDYIPYHSTLFYKT